MSFKHVTSLRILLCIAALVVGCTSGASSQLPTPPPITAIPPSRQPTWLSIVFPKPGQIVSLDQYNSKDFLRTGVVVEALSPGTVCLDIWAYGLVTKGDFWKAKDVVQRTTILVDGIPREAIEDTIQDGRTAFIFGLPPTIPSPSAPTPQITQAPPRVNVGGPYGWCVSAPLAAGLHRAEVSFKKSGSQILSFAWTFTLTDGAE